MGDFLKLVIFGMIPPRTNDPDSLYRWQSAVAIAVYFCVAGVLGIFILAFGLTPVYGGFAKASVLETVSTALTDIKSGQTRARIHEIDVDIQSTETRICTKDKDNEDAIGFANEQINTWKGEYYDLTGKLYRVPPCGIL